MKTEGGGKEEGMDLAVAFKPRCDLLPRHSCTLKFTLSYGNLSPGAHSLYPRGQVSDMNQTNQTDNQNGNHTNNQFLYGRPDRGLRVHLVVLQVLAVKMGVGYFG